tara:strand:- start:66 stop:1598 length:1533 start_codon:yes stop_codon:yes gene_type:complete
MQIVKVDPLRPVYIYIVTDRCTDKIIYVGQTVDCTRRWVQHEKSERTSLQDYAERHDRTFDMFKFKKVDALPMGCAQVDANRMEAYFIAEFETIYSSKNNKDVANKTAGNHATSYVHAEVKAELEKGYQWPEGCEAQVAAMAAEPKDVEQARADLAILQSIAEDNPELESQIRPILAKTEQTLQDLQTGPYDRAKEAYEKYCEMPPHEPVPRDDLMATVNAVKDLTPDDPAVQQRWKKVWTPHMHSDSNKTTISVEEAMFIMGAVKAWLGDHAETKLTLTTTTAKRCLELRSWLAAQNNDGKAPSQNAKTRKTSLANVEAATQEASLGAWMHDWKGQYGKPESGTVRVLLRHWPKVLNLMLGKSKDEKTLDVARRANALLKGGYAVFTERTARPEQSVGLTPLITTTDGKDGKEVYQFVHNFLLGTNPAMADALLEGVDADRAKWMRDTNLAKQSDAKETKRQKNEAATERRQAVAKKRKGESSTAPELDAQDDSESDDDDEMVTGGVSE